MAKDPAFLFYSADFLTGVADLTMEERGQYITLLCLQHQKGELSEKTIKLAVGNVSDDVLSKFTKLENGNFINKRLLNEMVKRDKFTPYKIASATLGGLISSHKELTTKQIQFIKSQFNIKDFLFEDKEKIKTSISEWLSECLTIFENENENESKDIKKGEDFEIEKPDEKPIIKKPKEEFDLLNVHQRIPDYIYEYYTPEQVHERNLKIADELLNSDVWIESVARQANLQTGLAKTKVKEFLRTIETGHKNYDSLSKIKSYFSNWIKTNKTLTT